MTPTGGERLAPAERLPGTSASRSPYSVFRLPSNAAPAVPAQQAAAAGYHPGERELGRAGERERLQRAGLPGGQSRADGGRAERDPGDADGEAEADAIAHRTRLYRGGVSL